MHRYFSRVSFVFLFLNFFIALIAASPELVRVVKDGGISVRELPKSSNIVSQVYTGYTYPVIDSTVGYFKIKFSDSISGWVFANASQGWTAVSANMLTIMNTGGITVRQSPFDSKSDVLGFAGQGKQYLILEEL